MGTRRGSIRVRVPATGQQAAAPEVGQQARQARRANFAEALLGRDRQVGERASSVEQLKELGIGIGKVKEASAA